MYLFLEYETLIGNLLNLLYFLTFIWSEIYKIGEIQKVKIWLKLGKIGKSWLSGFNNVYVERYVQNESMAVVAASARDPIATLSAELPSPSSAASGATPSVNNT